MALIRCPECNKEISDTAKKCQYCGCNIKAVIKRAEQVRKQKEAQEAWENASPKEKAVINTITWIIIGIIVIFIFKACSTTYDSNECSACNGSGYYQKKTCPICKGSGHSDYDPYEQYKNIGK